jgi:hypothetical protein
MGFQDTFGHKEKIGFARLSGPGYIVATGGTVTRDGNYLVHTFTGSGTLNITALSTIPAYNSLQYLIVAGGGGGAYSGGGVGGGGGGGGGLLYGLTTAIINPYSVLIGSGGVGDVSVAPSNGNNSSFGIIVAQGGGAGGDYPTNALNGGSGGGGFGFTGNTIGLGIPGQGNDGSLGQFTYPFTAGSGGGAGAVGGNYSGFDSGQGGNGLSYSITGIVNFYAGGGAGGSGFGSTTRQSGGNGGGGRGGFRNPSSINTDAKGQDGAINTGGGGGGTSPWPINGSNGGSGIVIIRYFKPL